MTPAEAGGAQWLTSTRFRVSRDLKRSPPGSIVGSLHGAKVAIPVRKIEPEGGKKVPHGILSYSPQVEVIDCDQIRGGERPIVAKLPAAPGIYAWYKKLLPPDPNKSDAQAYAHFVLKETRLPHCLERRTRIRPLYALSLRSQREFSEGKTESLEKLCANIDFRRFLYDLLHGNSLLFQQPLYIGKADSLAKRVGDHLAGKSSLKQRLEKASINIFRCYLAYVEVPDWFIENSSIESNLLVEEILSRLFYPTFTERYG